MWRIHKIPFSALLHQTRCAVNWDAHRCPGRFKQEAFQNNRARDGDRRTAVIPLVGWRNLGRPFYGFTIPGTLFMGTVLTVWMMISD